LEFTFTRSHVNVFNKVDVNELGCGKKILWDAFSVPWVLLYAYNVLCFVVVVFFLIATNE
jgi:hypothetical protein